MYMQPAPCQRVLLHINKFMGTLTLGSQQPTSAPQLVFSSWLICIQSSIYMFSLLPLAISSSIHLYSLPGNLQSKDMH